MVAVVVRMDVYTEEGNWDLVGNNTPIFFIRDPIHVSHPCQPHTPLPPIDLSEILMEPWWHADTFNVLYMYVKDYDGKTDRILCVSLLIFSSRVSFTLRKGTLRRT